MSYGKRVTVANSSFSSDDSRFDERSEERPHSSIVDRVRTFWRRSVRLINMPYKFFTSKNENTQPMTTDVFNRPSITAGNSRISTQRVESVSKSAKVQKSPSIQILKRRSSPDCCTCKYPNAISAHCNVCRRYFPSTCRPSNGLNISCDSFYGKARKPDCITLTEDDDATNRPPLHLADTRKKNENEAIADLDLEDTTVMSENLFEISAETWHLNHSANQNYLQSERENEEVVNGKHAVKISNQDMDLKEVKICFGTYKCVAKGIKFFADFVKFLNIPPIQQTTDKPFKFHIAVPTIEIKEAYRCFYEGKVVLVIRVVPESTVKIQNALGFCQSSPYKFNPDDEGGNAKFIIVFAKEEESYVESVLKHSDKLTLFKQLQDVEAKALLKSQIYESQRMSRTECEVPIIVDFDEKQSNQKKMRSHKSEVIEIIDDCQSTNTASTVVLNYKDEMDSITMYEQDMQCLEHEQFLNDSILGFYLKYILKELTEEPIRSKTYIFSTFFYGRITAKGRSDEDKDKAYAERIYDRVKNWTKSVDIFEKDFLIIPMNKQFHWFLAIVCYPGRVSTFNSENRHDVCRPCIIYMDSLAIAVTRSRLGDPIRHFLTMEWKSRKGTDVTFNKSLLPDFYPRVPFQTNSSDCGLFVLQYVENFLKDPQYVLDNLGNVELENWFPVRLIDRKRKDLLELILTLSELEKNKAQKMDIYNAQSDAFDEDVDTECPIPISTLEECGRD